MASSPFHKDDDNAPISDVNVVPLADVSLVLLIILLVLSPMAAQSMLRIQSEAARAKAATPPIRDEIVVQRELEAVLSVGVTQMGFIVNGELMTSPRVFSSWLQIALAGRVDRKVFVAPELDVEHGRVVAALEAVQTAGGTAALVQVFDPQVP
jgi:biopolymer transport protein ExbD